MKLAEPVAHSMVIFHVAACLQIQILMNPAFDNHKLRPFLFGFLYKGIMFCSQPSITSGHIILFKF
jgi:hypothetical protein